VALRAGAQRTGDITVQNTQVENFSPLHALSKLDSYLSNVLQRSKTVQDIRPFMVATRAWWPGGEQPGGYTDIVLARGIEMDVQLTTFAWLRSAGGLVLICILDYITLLLATFLVSVLHVVQRTVCVMHAVQCMSSLFFQHYQQVLHQYDICTLKKKKKSHTYGMRCTLNTHTHTHHIFKQFLTPLENMAKRIRGGQKVDIAYLKSLTKRRWYMVVVAAVGVCSLLVAIWVRADGKHTMEQAVEARSRNNCGTIKMSYRLVLLLILLLLLSLPPTVSDISCNFVVTEPAVGTNLQIQRYCLASVIHYSCDKCYLVSTAR
jgi:hypothetical protein